MLPLPPGITTRAAPTAVPHASAGEPGRRMHFEPVADFSVAHAYPAGQSPGDEHPPQWGKLVLHRCFRIDGVDLVIRSTERRKDGWSYNVAEQRDRPVWVGYYHHRPSGKRVRAANSPNALQLAQVLNAL